MTNNFIFVSFSFLFGLCIGSFLNAVIFRLPKKISLSASRSHCPKCDKLIYWYENIPLVSYLWLRGRCSGCKTKISVQYPLVELTVGLFAALITPTAFDSNALWSYFFFLTVFASFLAIVIIDLKHKLIPNGINAYLFVLFFSSVVLIKPWPFWLFGLALGALIPISVTYIFYLLRGQIGLGGGDIKLWAALGLYLGPVGISYNIFLSSFLGALIGGFLTLLKVVDRKTPIPFGPFIIIVASAQIFIPDYFDRLMSMLLP
jgi:prepilin signal peptidase PulO-like enzyme (type II secretory pathway)